MELSNRKSEKLFCLKRQEWVAATPEEHVRQNLLLMMKQRLGYPAGGIALEASLNQMPHLALFPSKLPNRRADIVCFGSNIHPKFPLYPLLLIECKAVKLTSKVFNQVMGYNHYLSAIFIAVANQDTIQTGWYDRSANTYVFINGLPSYQELLSKLSR